jgi:DNA-binding winged helix-turn-helix (wHTH) protein
LARNCGNPVSRACILREVWKTHSDKPSNIVDVYVNYLRKKVDENEACKLVQTIRGVGYSLGAHGASELQQTGAISLASVVHDRVDQVRGVHSA